MLENMAGKSHMVGGLTEGAVPSSAEAQHGPPPRGAQAWAQALAWAQAGAHAEAARAWAGAPAVVALTLLGPARLQMVLALVVVAVVVQTVAVQSLLMIVVVVVVLLLLQMVSC